MSKARSGEDWFVAYTVNGFREVRMYFTVKASSRAEVIAWLVNQEASSNLSKDAMRWWQECRETLQERVFKNVDIDFGALSPEEILEAMDSANLNTYMEEYSDRQYEIRRLPADQEITD